MAASCEPDTLPPMVTIRTGEPCSDVTLGICTEKGGVEWLSMNSRPLSRADAHALDVVVVSFTDITEQKRAEQRLRVQHAITRVVAEATTLKEAASVILETICEPLGWSLGILWIVDRQGKVLRYMDSWALPKADMESFQRASEQWSFPEGVGLPGRVWESRAPAWIVDIAQDRNFPRLPIAAAVGLHAAAAFPILLGGTGRGRAGIFHAGRSRA